jgi:hypothetical protein
MECGDLRRAGNEGPAREVERLTAEARAQSPASGRPVRERERLLKAGLATEGRRPPEYYGGGGSP